MKTSENKNSSSNKTENSKNDHPIDKNNLKSKVENDTNNPWKNPDPTNPKRSPEKVNEPYARQAGEATNDDQQGKTTGNYTGKDANSTPNPKERITNQGNTEKHSPVNKSDQQH